MYQLDANNFIMIFPHKWPLLIHMMHGHTYMKFACAKQAKDAHAYKNTKRRLYKLLKMDM